MNEQLLKKLKIKSPHVLLMLNIPKDVKTLFADLPDGVSITSQPHQANSIHWFVHNQKEVDTQIRKVVDMLNKDNVCWAYYPKKSGSVQTDLTRDKGWDTLLKEKKLKWLTLISFNDTWSAFAFRLKTAADEKQKPKERVIFQYADSATKTIYLPDDMKKSLASNKSAQAFFESLSFSHKREYVEWIVTAKKPETRSKRLTELVDLLLAKKKERR
jgi:hypothetical protein